MKVLTKLTHYTSFTKQYLSGVQLKTRFFFETLEKLRVHINTRIAHSCEHDWRVIDFTFDNDVNTYIPSNIWVSHLYFSDDKVSVDWSGKIVNSDCSRILFHSVVGQVTITHHGLDGFVALLITFINEDGLTTKINSLLTSCNKLIATQFNSMAQVDCTINESSFVSNIHVKRLLGAWIDFLKQYKRVHSAHIDAVVRHTTIIVQKVFFKQYIFKNTETVRYTYHTNYDESIDKLNLGDAITKARLVPFIKTIFRITTLEQWSDYLESLLELSENDIIKIFLSVDSSFGQVFLRTDLRNNYHAVVLKCESRRPQKKVRDTWYDQTITLYNIDGSTMYYGDYIYDENLCLLSIKEKFRSPRFRNL
jgi:hypothetical protein